MKAMKMFVMALAVSTLGLVGCNTICAGTNCICPEGETCSFDVCSSSTSGCNFDCGGDATCSGTCGPSCNVACTGESCTHTVGEGSSVACTSGSCNITCEGSCIVSGNVNLTCKNGTKGPAGCN